MRNIIRLLLLCLLIYIISCTPKVEKKEGEKLLVVTTTNIIGDVLTNILQDEANVISLMGPSVDPHLYKATQGDLRKLENADIIIHNGLHLEGKMADILTAMKKSGKKVYTMAEGLEDHKLRKTGESTYDPHIWFDLSLWANATEKVGKALLDNFPENQRKKIESQTKAYCDTLLKVHTEVQVLVNTIPQQQRVLVTAHDAFGYFGAAYGIEVYGIQGISTVSEAGLKEVKTLAERLAERKIKAVFIENSVSSRQIEALIRACHDKDHEINLGGILYSDALGSNNARSISYIQMIRHNVATIVNALQQ